MHGRSPHHTLLKEQVTGEKSKRNGSIQQANELLNAKE